MSCSFVRLFLHFYLIRACSRVHRIVFFRIFPTSPKGEVIEINVHKLPRYCFLPLFTILYMFTALVVRFIAFWIKELSMFVKTPLMKRTQGVMIDWYGWLVYWSVVCLGVFCCEGVLVIIICGSPTPCCMLLYPSDPHGLIWSTPISGWAGHLTVVVLHVRF